MSEKKKKTKSSIDLQNLSDADKLAIAQGVYGEYTGNDDAIRKMIIQSVLNRARSGRTKEFGTTIPEILQKGYYAVSRQNQPYKEVMSGTFDTEQGRNSFAEIYTLLQAIVGDKDYGDVMFYHTDDEIKRQKAKGGFNYDAVKKLGKVDKYNTYGY